ncbi:MAG: glutaredoxin family protein [Pirellulaceae bacterium]
MSVWCWLTDRLAGRRQVETPSADSGQASGQWDVLIYTRPGCHLCEEAEQVLGRYGLTPREVNIDEEPALRARYTDCVPVVVIDGQERFRGRVNEVLLRRLLRDRDRKHLP